MLSRVPSGKPQYTDTNLEKIVYRNKIDTLYTQGNDGVFNHLGEVVLVLLDIVRNEDASTSNRIKASKILLDQANLIHALSQENRLDILEQKIKDLERGK